MTTYGEDFGILMGYPKCCIHAFVYGDSPGKHRSFNGTGFIPCRDCDSLARAMGTNAFVERHIAPNRKVSTPFPIEPRDDDPLMVELRRKHPKNSRVASFTVLYRDLGLI